MSRTCHEPQAIASVEFSLIQGHSPITPRLITEGQGGVSSEKRATCTNEYIPRQQEYVLFIDIKHTTCSGFIAKLSTTPSRRHWSQHPLTRTAQFSNTGICRMHAWHFWCDAEMLAGTGRKETDSHRDKKNVVPRIPVLITCLQVPVYYWLYCNICN